tara:strand:+ start:48 stop:578 length:531 start_codon:yes stop_codon:yes gene_type:complete
MEIAPEFASTRSTAHASNDAITNDQGSNVGAVRFGNVFLNEDGFFGVQKTLYKIPSFVVGVTQKHTLALGSFGYFDNDRKASNGFNGVLDIGSIANVHRLWNWNFVPRKKLRCMQFISALQNTLARVGGPHAHLLKVAQDCNTVSRDGVTDSWDNRIKGCRSTFVHNIDTVVVNEQ